MAFAQYRTVKTPEFRLISKANQLVGERMPIFPEGRPKCIVLALRAAVLGYKLNTPPAVHLQIYGPDCFFADAINEFFRLFISRNP